MKLSQSQLRKLITEAIVGREPGSPLWTLDESGPDPRRIDKGVTSDIVNTEASDFVLDLASQVIHDKSLKFEDKVLAYISKSLSNAGVGGAGVPRLDRHDLYDILGDDFLNEKLREF